MKHSPLSVWLDHFVVAINDLSTGIEAFTSMTGVRPAKGGEHPTLGTHNALVSLGPPCYFEILAPRIGATLAPMWEGVDQCRELTPFLWVAATDNIVGVHDLVSAAGFGVNDVVVGTRRTDGGDTLRWKMFTLKDNRLSNAPFFIEWDATTNHPSTTTPTGCTLKSFKVTTPDSVFVNKLLNVVGYPLQVHAGPKQIQIHLDTPKGAVTVGG